MTIINIKKEIENEIIEVCNKTFNICLEEVILEIPKNNQNGHLTTNVALKNSKIIHKNPLEIGEELKKSFKSSLIKEIEVVKPGFINFTLTEKVVLSLLNEISVDQNYGKKEISGEKILIEYLSANPTGDLHLGHARNGILGDSLSRIMKYAGYDVTTEYYVNDAGKQILNLALSIQYFYLAKFGKEECFPEEGYRGEDIRKISENLFQLFGESKINSEIEFYKEYGIEQCLVGIKGLLNSINISFDNWTSEQSLYDTDKVNDVLHILKDNEMTYEEDGAIWLKTTEFFDEKDRVIVKKDKSLTYLTPDIAYHLDKFDRGYDHLINIFGGDHHGYIDRLRSSICSLGHNGNDLEVIVIQMVSILNDKKAVKMSKRNGTSVTIKDLLKEIDADVLRYFFVNKSNDTQLDFDLKEAKEQSSDNPIYYIQYAHARICSIIKSANEKNIELKIPTILNKEEENLVLKMSLLPEIIQLSAQNREPHRIANYVYELAAQYHSYYAKYRVYTEELDYTMEKLYFANSVKKIIALSLDLIGIDAKTEM